MKTNKQKELLRILSETERSISAVILAGMLGISERTLRNYVKELNENEHITILSSREGYRIQEKAPVQEEPSENEFRSRQVLSDLLTRKDGVNAFDEAERLFVSTSTVINSIIPSIKGVVKGYGLSIESHNYQFYLKGSERNKRRLIGYLATSDTYCFWGVDEEIGRAHV